MKKLFKAGGAALLAMSLAIPAAALARTTINMADGPVVFSHERHVNMACVTCHAAAPAATAPVSPVRMTLPSSCGNCHILTDEKPPSEGCANCHNDVSLL